MFTDWIGGQPNNVGGKENYAHFNYDLDYKWNDYLCEYETKAICENKQN